MPPFVFSVTLYSACLKCALISTALQGMVKALSEPMVTPPESTSQRSKTYPAFGVAVRVTVSPFAAEAGVALALPFSSSVTVTSYCCILREKEVAGFTPPDSMMEKTPLAPTIFFPSCSSQPSANLRLSPNTASATPESVQFSEPPPVRVRPSA